MPAFASAEVVGASPTSAAAVDEHRTDAGGPRSGLAVHVEEADVSNLKNPGVQAIARFQQNASEGTNVTKRRTIR